VKLNVYKESSHGVQTSQRLLTAKRIMTQPGTVVPRNSSPLSHNYFLRSTGTEGTPLPGSLGQPESQISDQGGTCCISGFPARQRIHFSVSADFSRGRTDWADRIYIRHYAHNERQKSVYNATPLRSHGAGQPCDGHGNNSLPHIESQKSNKCTTLHLTLALYGLPRMTFWVTKSTKNRFVWLDAYYGTVNRTDVTATHVTLQYKI